MFCGCASQGITDTDLEEAFGKFGRVAKVWVARQPSGFGFVEFEEERDADDAIKEMDGKEIKGHGLKVEMSRSGGQKAEQKPGDWICDSCGVNNFARREECFRCGAPKRSGGGGGGRGGYDDRRDRYDDRGGRGGNDDRRDRYDDRRDDRRRSRSRSPDRRRDDREDSRDRRRD